MINKKRGYKSSRKAKGEEDGVLIDGMEIAKKLYNGDLTPGQLCLQLLESGKKVLPDFYRSDLQEELDRIWNVQKQFRPDVFCDAAKEEIKGKTEVRLGLFWLTILLGKKKWFAGMTERQKMRR